MSGWQQALISECLSIRETLAIIDRTALQIALVVDEGNRLLGVVTDGDVRRGILLGVSLERPVSEIMSTRFSFVTQDADQAQVLRAMQARMLRHIPVLDLQGRIVDLKIYDILADRQRKNTPVVLMAGGLGTRLGQLTKDCPKPLLKVGGKPILERIMLSFLEQGFYRLFLAVNYKAQMFEDYFGDGLAWGMEITYLHESKPLGTAGALSLMPKVGADPLIVMNGDLMTKVSFTSLLDFHHEHQAAATMCVRQYDMQVPFGVVNTDNYKLTGLTEKPVHTFFVNAGIYVLNPETLDVIPRDSFFDMPDLFQHLMQQGKPAAAFPVYEYWLDVGRVPDFERANGDFGA